MTKRAVALWLGGFAHSSGSRSELMKIVLTGVLVDDRGKALAFHRDVLGFKPRLDVPVASTAG